MKKLFNCGLGTAGLTCEEINIILTNVYKFNNNAHLIVDTAMAYNTEIPIGAFIIKSNDYRKNLFIIDKINYENQKIGVRASLEKSLKKLNTDYIDLLCIHSPRYANYIQTWKEMEKVKDEGIVKQIGLSNFYSDELKKVISITNHCVFSNQLPLNINCKLTKQAIKVCYNNHIAIQACMVFKNALSNNKLLSLLNKLAYKYDATIYQVLISALLQNKITPIIGTRSYKHFISNNTFVKMTDFDTNIICMMIGLNLKDFL